MSYPNSFPTFVEKENLPGLEYKPEEKKTLFAEDINKLQDEVLAIEQGVGLKGQPGELLTDLFEDFESRAFLAAHPVGSTYWNELDDTNPSEIWGGEWEALEGVVLGGRELGQSIFNAAGGTIVGEDTVILTAMQIPQLEGQTSSDGAHTHSMSPVRTGAHNSGPDTNWTVPSQNSGGIRSTGSAGNHSHDVTVNSGGGLAHNNVQRTLIGYLWKRTA